MDARHLLAAAIAVAAAAACTQPTSELGPRRVNASTDETAITEAKGGEQGGAAADGSTDETPTGPVPTNSPEGKAFYKSSVHPFMATACGACHGAAGPGPEWLTSADAEKSYAQLFKVGYVTRQSRIVTKGTHGGSATNALDATQKATYEQWIEMELADGGGEAPPNVLAKLGACFNRALFDDMDMGAWRTTRRSNRNNANDVTPWNENADECTGCDNAPCTTCHSADPATNFNNAVGNTLLPADTTFENTKSTTPAYITKFFGVSPDGKAIGSDGIKKKSDATMKDKAYTHPMYQLTADQQTALTAFVNDAITKYNAGSCGQ